jgi:hypothetical protein
MIKLYHKLFESRSNTKLPLCGTQYSIRMEYFVLLYDVVVFQGEMFLLYKGQKIPLLGRACSNAIHLHHTPAGGRVCKALFSICWWFDGSMV